MDDYERIAAELSGMADADQRMRERARTDPDAWDVEVDRANTGRLKEIIAGIGWPTVSKVGRAGASAAWLVAQHAPDDLDFMKYCLELMKQAGPGEVRPSEVALLEDRVRIAQGQPQRYGTQYCDLGNGYEPFPIEDPERVDERRAAVGLDTLAENIARVRKLYPVKDR
ncbi:DUF6624 domain-containing protein [Micromonospora sp. NPDC049559]|uniref:DUF6624 domain-containing protein n=1 Tax=Micromonospora sp. NPDC049559 TaxID=3155923 RepID=UPI00342FA399